MAEIINSSIPSIAVIIIALIFIVVIMKYCITLFKNKDIKQLKISKDGLEISSNKPSASEFRFSKVQLLTMIIDIVTRVKESSHDEIDDIRNLKDRIFKQSKDYLESSLYEIMFKIIEDYKSKYVQTYTNKDYVYKCINISTTKSQLEKQNNKNEDKEIMCSDCNTGCNSGVYYFECRFLRDINIIKDSLFNLIEENHLINRSDREYEEEISRIANMRTNETKSKLISYTLPVDNMIAGEIFETHRKEFCEKIEDSLRRSRTLSQNKRDQITEIKSKYADARFNILSNSLNILDDSLSLKAIDDKKIKNEKKSSD